MWRGEVDKEYTLSSLFWSRYPDDLHWAESTSDIESAWSAGKIASMIGVESGHAIGSSLPILRTLYAMGARYVYTIISIDYTLICQVHDTDTCVQHTMG